MIINHLEIKILYEVVAWSIQSLKVGTVLKCRGSYFETLKRTTSEPWNFANFKSVLRAGGLAGLVLNMKIENGQ